MDQSLISTLIHGVETAPNPPIAAPPNFQGNSTVWPPRDRGTIGALRAALQAHQEVASLETTVARLERGQQNAARLTYSPNNPDPKPGTYQTWEELYVAFLETQGGVEIWLDYANGIFGVPDVPSSMAVFPIPPGSYDFQDRAIFIGHLSSAQSVLLPDGPVTLANIDGLYGAVGIVNNQPTPLMELGQYQEFIPQVFIIERGAFIASLAGAAPVVVAAVTPPSPQSVVGLTIGALLLDLGAPAIEVASGGMLILSLFASSVGAQSIAGPADSALLELVEVGNSASSESFPLFNGTHTVILQQPARLIGYMPDQPADWNGNPPTQIAEALDRIAALIGPIP